MLGQYSISTAIVRVNSTALCWASGVRLIIKSNGVKINDIIFNDDHFSLNKYAKKKSEIKVSVGKKKIGIIKVI